MELKPSNKRSASIDSDMLKSDVKKMRTAHLQVQAPMDPALLLFSTNEPAVNWSSFPHVLILCVYILLLAIPLVPDGHHMH